MKKIMFFLLVLSFTFNLNAQNEEKQSDACIAVGSFIFGARLAGDVVACSSTLTGNWLGAIGCYDIVDALKDPEGAIEGHTSMACFWKVKKKKLDNGDIEVKVTIKGSKEEVDEILAALKLESKEPNSCSIKYSKNK